jgi:hypothetical protein
MTGQIRVFVAWSETEEGCPFETALLTKSPPVRAIAYLFELATQVVKVQCVTGERSPNAVRSVRATWTLAAMSGQFS